MSNTIFKGPLLVLILGVVAFLGYRFVPIGDLLERFGSGAGQGSVVGRDAPSMPEPAAVETMPSPGTSVPPVAATPTGPAPSAGAEGSADAEVLTPVAEPQPRVRVSKPEMPAAPGPQVPSPPAPVVLPTVQKAPAQVAVPPRAAESKTKPVQEPEPVAAVRKPVVAAVPAPAPVVAAAPEPALPNLRVFVQADVHDRAGLEKYTAGGYADALKKELAAVALDYLGKSAVQRGDPNLTFRDQLAEGREGYERFCAQAQAQRVLLADVVINAAGFSSIDSAYWPEVYFVAINCADGRVHKSPRKRLEPSNMDSFEFQQQFRRRSEDFIASQGYFLKP